ncbi:MAG: hypothetical protein ACU83V_03680 [Gammaproteobacteria bacterium]
MYRCFDADGLLAGDTAALADASCEGELLKTIMREGVMVELPRIEQSRANAKEQLSRLPEGLRVLRNAPVYPVQISTELREPTERMEKGTAFH